MTPLETRKHTMPIGTPVTVKRDSGEILVTTTRSEPWQLGSGHWVVSVVGISGGYDLDRVMPVPEGA